MPVKRFIAADMRRALAMVREELGDDAMIMSTQRSKKGVELIASADEEVPITSAQTAKQTSLNNTNTVRASSTKVRAHSARLSPRIEQYLNQEQVADNTSRLGLASGKTQEELANELERARKRMLASKRQESMTLGEWAEQEEVREKKLKPIHNQPNGKPQPAAYETTTPENNFGLIEERIDQIIQKTQQQQAEVTEKTDKEIRELQNEILSMRSIFAEQLNAMADMQNQHFNEVRSHREVVPIAQTIKQRLQGLGLTQHCTDNILKSLKSIDSQTMSIEGLWKESLARLSHRIKTYDGDMVKGGGIFAFWGPTGVGKTTTIAKLAARFVIEQKGRRDIVLLSTDRFRIAAHDQLKSLGQILDVQVEIIEDLKQLPKQLERFGDKALVLIDTPGMSHQDEMLNEHIRVMRRCKNIHHSLVLSANSQYQMLQACVHSYRLLGIQSCVLTKLDECASLGDGISVLAANKLALSYITDGQCVPEDIATIRPHQLVTRALALSKRYSERIHKSAKVPETV